MLLLRLSRLVRGVLPPCRLLLLLMLDGSGSLLNRLAELAVGAAKPRTGLPGLPVALVPLPLPLVDAPMLLSFKSSNATRFAGDDIRIGDPCGNARLLKLDSSSSPTLLSVDFLLAREEEEALEPSGRIEMLDTRRGLLADVVALLLAVD